MATILAINNGNWSASGTWTSGIIPTTGDIVVANNRTVTVDVSPLVSQVRNDTAGGATAGGTFTLSSGVTLSADNFFSATTNCVLFSSAGTATISGIINGQTSVNTIAVGTVRNGGVGTLIINGTAIGPSSSSTNSTIVNNNGTLVINGAVSGGVSNSDQRCVYVPAGSTGTVIINGNVAGSTGGFAVQIVAGSLIISSGTITGGTVNNAVSYTSTSSGIINSDIIGPTAGTFSTFYFNSLGTLTVNGKIRGGSSAASALQNVTNGTIVVNNTITGGPATNGVGLTNSANGTVIVSGNVFGNIGNGIINSSAGSVIINGSAIAVSGAAVYNASTGPVYATLAKGNGYGIGSSGISYAVGIANNIFGPCYVSGLEFGDLGASPVYGPIQFLDSTSNTCSMYRPSGLSKKVLVDITNVSGLLPKTTDVRKNVSYNLGNNIGSLNMPSSGSVAFGVPVDNTTGIAILSSASQIWDYPSANITGVNSIGNRLKNCSTVENLGSQLSNALSAINS